MEIHSALPTWHLTGKKVLVRADLNVPLIAGKIQNDFRLRSIKKTIDFILMHGGMVILATHLGRPKAPCAELSTKNLVPWFVENNYAIHYHEHIHEPIPYAQNSVTLLENLRFYAGEKNRDLHFAQTVASLGDYYVNDAFGTMHRDDSSVSLVPRFFDRTHKTFGFLVEKEINYLNKLLHTPQKPFVLVIGGGKVTDKLPVIENLLGVADTILLCPAIVFTFLTSMNKSIGKSLVDRDAIDLCAKILKTASDKKVRIELPLDFLVRHENGTLSVTNDDSIPADTIGISIGPKTIERWQPLLREAHTLFFNAAMGFAEQPETLVGAQQLLKIIAKSDALSVIGGGDSVSMAQALGDQYAWDFLSTGGGATLSYLSGNTLPGLRALDITGV